MERRNYLLLHCVVVYELQSFDFSMTGARWVMPKMVLKELGGWRNLFDQHRSLIWNMIPLWLMGSLERRNWKSI